MPPLFPLLPLFAPLCINVDQELSFSDPLFPTNTFFSEAILVSFSGIQVNNFCLYGNLQISFCCCTGILLVSHVSALMLSPALLNCSAGSLLPSLPWLRDGELMLVLTATFLCRYHWCLGFLAPHVHTFPSSPVLGIPGSCLLPLT